MEGEMEGVPSMIVEHYGNNYKDILAKTIDCEGIGIIGFHETYTKDG